MEHLKEEEVKEVKEKRAARVARMFKGARNTKKPKRTVAKTDTVKLHEPLGVEVKAYHKEVGVTEVEVGLTKLVKSAYVCRAIIQDEDLDIKFTGRHIIFEIFGTKIVTDAEEFFISEKGDKKIDIDIKDVNDLYLYVAVQVMKHTGMRRHKNRCITMDDIEPTCRAQLERIVKYELKGVSVETLFQNMVCSIGSPAEVGEDLGVPARLIKNMRVINRKRIIAWAKQEGIKVFNSSLMDDK